jgi:hypothetical protein
MQIKVEFTIDVPREALPALREVADSCETNEQARVFVKALAQDLTTHYLQDHGVALHVRRGAVTTY